MTASDRILVEKDGGLTYFLISSSWIRTWRDYQKYGGEEPGKILNEPVARKIYRQRTEGNENRYLFHDNLIRIEQPEDAYIVSVDLWKNFAALYHADMIIQIRKYDENALLGEQQ